MKKLLSSFLAIVLIIGSLNSVILAKETGTYVELAEHLKSVGVFQGTSSGFELDREPSRIEGGVMFVRLLGGEEEAKDKRKKEREEKKVQREAEKEKKAKERDLKTIERQKKVAEKAAEAEERRKQREAKKKGKSSQGKVFVT